jgi:pyridoxamine 5'-phosphate oxidase
MQNDLGDYRKSYEKGILLEENLPQDPMRLFHTWFQEARACKEILEVNAMTLVTAGLDGYPKGRIVLLKKYGIEGFRFYTNYHSEKGRAIAVNSKVGLSFFWDVLERQIIIKGIAERILESESERYFQSRPTDSKLSTLASFQSEVISSREDLEIRFNDFQNYFKDKPIPKPPYWGGYAVKPAAIEFWQGRPNRLHDRILYTKQENNSWTISRLFP